jgi:hypothetical protein
MKIAETKLHDKIREVCKLPLDFEMKPKMSFYDKVGINQKRFGQLMKGTAIANAVELRAIADYFQIDANELF